MNNSVYEYDSVYTLKNYGEINVNLKEVMNKKGIKRGKLSNMAAMSYDLVNRYYNNKVRRVDLDVIARFCYVLGCGVEDILKYTPDEKSN